MRLRERGTSDRCRKRKEWRQLELGFCGARVIESKLSGVFDLALALASRTEAKAQFLTFPAAYSYDICGCLLLAADDSPAKIIINCLFRRYGFFSLRQARELALNRLF